MARVFDCRSLVFLLLCQIGKSTPKIVNQTDCRVAFCVSGVVPGNVPVALYASTIRTFVVESLTKLGPHGRQRCTGDVFLYMVGTDEYGIATDNFSSRTKEIETIFDPWLVNANAVDALPPRARPSAPQDQGTEEVSSALYQALYPSLACFKLVEEQERKWEQNTTVSYRWVVQLSFLSIWLAPIPAFTSPGSFPNDRIHATGYPILSPLKFALVPRHFAEQLFYTALECNTPLQGELLDNLMELYSKREKNMHAMKHEMVSIMLQSRLRSAGIPIQQASFPRVDITPGTNDKESAIHCADVGFFHNLICAILEIDTNLLPECRQLVAQSYTGLCSSMVKGFFNKLPGSPPTPFLSSNIDSKIAKIRTWLAENISPTDSLFINMIGQDDKMTQVEFLAADVGLMMSLLRQLLPRNYEQHRQLYLPSSSQTLAATALAEQELFLEFYTLESKFWSQLIPWQDLMLRLNKNPGQEDLPRTKCQGRCGRSSSAHAHNDAEDLDEEAQSDVVYWGRESGLLPRYCADYRVDGSYAYDCSAPIQDSPSGEGDREITTDLFRAAHTSDNAFVANFSVRFEIPNVVLFYDEEQSPTLHDVLTPHVSKKPPTQRVQQDALFLVHHMQDLTRAVAQFCKAHHSNHECVVAASARVLRALKSEIVQSIAHLSKESQIMLLVQNCSTARGLTILEELNGPGSITDKLLQFGSANPFLVEDALSLSLSFQMEVDEGRGLLDRQDSMIKVITDTLLRGKDEFVELIASWEAPALYGLPPSNPSDESCYYPRTLDVISVIGVLLIGFDESRTSDTGYFVYPHQENAICPSIIATLFHRVGSLMYAQGKHERAMPWLRTAIAMQESESGSEVPSKLYQITNLTVMSWLQTYVHAVSMVTYAKNVSAKVLDEAAAYADALQLRSKTPALLYARAQLYFAAGDTAASKEIYRFLYQNTGKFDGTEKCDPNHPMHPSKPSSTKAAYLAEFELSDVPSTDPNRLQGVDATSIDRDTFNGYLESNHLHLVHNMTKGWNAVTSWSFDNIEETLGDEREVFQLWNTSNALTSLVTSVGPRDDYNAIHICTTHSSNILHNKTNPTPKSFGDVLLYSASSTQTRSSCPISIARALTTRMILAMPFQSG
jgi:hypothetical protein